MAGQRPFAVFDIDGTLVRWQLYHALADELARRGLLDADRYQAVKAARMNWKVRTNENSFQAYEATMVQLVDSALSGIRVSDLEQASQQVIAEYRDQVYTYTRDLIRDLQAKDYLLFAISASPSQLVELIAAHYGFDDACGSVYATKAGYFTGEKDLLLRERKPQKLRELTDRHHAGWQGSIGVGDSESDIPLLEAVERPIAFNPSKALYERARAQAWDIVVERKNVVYRLEPNDGSYLLA